VLSGSEADLPNSQIKAVKPHTMRLTAWLTIVVNQAFIWLPTPFQVCQWVQLLSILLCCYLSEKAYV